MFGLENFIIKPKDGNRYLNTKKVGDKEMIVCTSVEESKDVQRVGVVVGLPFNYKGDIIIGQEVIVHHNVFRITLNDWGVPMHSHFHIENDLYSVPSELIYMKIENGEYVSFDENVLIKPFFQEDLVEGNVQKRQIGVLEFVSKNLQKLGLKKDDIVVYKKDSEHYFNIDDKNYYRMPSDRVLAKVNY